MGESDPAQRFAEVYATLRERFVRRTQQQRIQLETAQARLRDEVTDETLKELEHVCHTLHGSAGTFGFPEVGVISGQAESAVRKAIRALEAGELVTEAHQTEIDDAIRRLCGTLKQTFEE